MVFPAFRHPKLIQLLKTSPTMSDGMLIIWGILEAL